LLEIAVVFLLKVPKYEKGITNHEGTKTLRKGFKLKEKMTNLCVLVVNFFIEGALK
jgi:hypothetical protein